MEAFKRAREIDIYSAIGRGVTTASSVRAEDKKLREEVEREQREAVVRFEEQKRLERLKQRLEWANIPKRYKNAELKPKSGVQEKLLTAFVKNIKDANGELGKFSDMLIFGGVGVGKTYLTIAMLKHIIKSGFYARYITEYDLLDLYFRKQYSKFDGFKEADLLVIDEIGKRELVDWQKVQFEEVISWRYNEMKPTFYITNLTAGELKKFIGDRAADRMRENRVILVPMAGESLRGGER